PVITCPRCKKLYRLRVEMLGRVVRCKRCDTSFQVPGKRPRERSEKSKAETKGNPQARVETPRATPTTHNAEAPGPRRRSGRVMLMGLLTLVLLLVIGGGVAAYLYWPAPEPDRRPFAATVAQLVKAMPGGQVAVDVTVDRGGYNGTVSVTAKSIPATLKA